MEKSGRSDETGTLTRPLDLAVPHIDVHRPAGNSRNNQRVEFFPEGGDDWEYRETGRKEASERPDSWARSPEEAAREFFRGGGVVVSDRTDNVLSRPSRLVKAGVFGAPLVAALLIFSAAFLTKGAHTAQVTHTPLHHATATPPPSTTATVPPPANTAVTVDVLDASGTGELASQTADGLRSNGFVVSGVNNAPNVIPPGDPSQIIYGPTGLPAAHALANSLRGPVTYIPSSFLAGNNVELLVASRHLAVNSTPPPT